MMSQPVPPSRESAATIASRRAARAMTAPSPAAPPARAPIDRAQDALPGPLRRFPLQVLLAAGGLAAAGTLVFVMGLARSDKAIDALEDETPVAAPVTAPATASARAPAAGPLATVSAAEPSATELDAARTKGVAALKDLDKRFPNNRGVLQALVVAEAQDKKDHPAALADLRHLLEIAPDKATDKEVQQALFEIANDVPPPDTAGDAINLMKSKMGPYGPDMLYEILTRAGSTKGAKDRAAAALLDAAVIKLESKALAVADELRRMPVCNRKKLVDRVKSEGDNRSALWLRQMLAPKTCGRLQSLLGADCGTACALAPAERKAVSDAVESVDGRDPAAARSAAPQRAPAPAPAPSAAPDPQSGMLK